MMKMMIQKEILSGSVVNGGISFQIFTFVYNVMDYWLHVPHLLSLCYLIAIYFLYMLYVK